MILVAGPFRRNVSVKFADVLGRLVFTQSLDKTLVLFIRQQNFLKFAKRLSRGRGRIPRIYFFFSFISFISFFT